MKLRRFQIAIIAVLGIVVGVWLLTGLSRTREPQYQGKSLTYWLLLAAGNSVAQVPTDYDLAMPAVRSIGTNALPCLVEWAGYEPPPWRHTLYRLLPARLQSNQRVTTAVLSEMSMRSSLAPIGFYILGTNAVPAIPQLEAIMNDRKRHWSAARAVEILASLGTPAFSVLTNAVADPQHTWRVLITVQLSETAPVSPVDRTNLYLPVLRQLMGEPDFLLSYAASNAVNKIEADLINKSPAQ